LAELLSRETIKGSARQDASSQLLAASSPQGGSGDCLRLLPQFYPFDDRPGFLVSAASGDRCMAASVEAGLSRPDFESSDPLRLISVYPHFSQWFP
jgi:hypothetical protein